MGPRYIVSFPFFSGEAVRFCGRSFPWEKKIVDADGMLYVFSHALALLRAQRYIRLSALRCKSARQVPVGANGLKTYTYHRNIMFLPAGKDALQKTKKKGGALCLEKVHLSSFV